MKTDRRTVDDGDGTLRTDRSTIHAELDSLRGVAVLSVLFFHGIAPPASPVWTSAERMLLSILGYGWVGVNLFFVLSGFLITGILIDSRNDGHYYSHFYARRALRILPALWSMLLLLLISGSIDWRFFGAKRTLPRQFCHPDGSGSAVRTVMVACGGGTFLSSVADGDQATRATKLECDRNLDLCFDATPALVGL